MQTDCQHILVVSHRRSGTHLTIDAIRNNFEAFEKSHFKVLDHLPPGTKKGVSTEVLKKQLSENNTVLKSHFLKDHTLYFPSRSDHAELVGSLFEKVPKIYVYRDGRDVMVSLYHYLRSYHAPSKPLSFKAFLRSANHFGPEGYTALNRVAFWRMHLESWLNKSENILFLSFEDLEGHYEATLEKLSGYLNLPVNGTIKDVRLRPQNALQKIREKLGHLGEVTHIRRTQVFFHKGVSGRYKKYFDEEDLDFFNVHAGEMLKRLGYD